MYLYFLDNLIVFSECPYAELKQDLSQGQDSLPDSALPIT